MVNKLLLLIVTMFMGNSNALTADCNYQVSSYKDNNGVDVLAPDCYACKDAKITKECDNDTEKIVAVSRNHMPSKTNKDVTLFTTKPRQKINKIPKDIGKFFPNLIVFTMPFAELESISSNDLELFLYIWDTTT